MLNLAFQNFRPIFQRMQFLSVATFFLFMSDYISVSFDIFILTISHFNNILSLKNW